MFNKGTWNDIKIRVRLNTPGQNDGALFVTVNGVDVSFDEMCWRKTSKVVISAIMFSTFYGGSSERFQCPCDTKARFKDFQLRKYAGVGARLLQSVSRWHCIVRTICAACISRMQAMISVRSVYTSRQRSCVKPLQCMIVSERVQKQRKPTRGRGSAFDLLERVGQQGLNARVAVTHRATALNCHSFVCVSKRCRGMTAFNSAIIAGALCTSGRHSAHSAAHGRCGRHLKQAKLEGGGVRRSDERFIPLGSCHCAFSH
jgi:hypothetical protein